MKRAIRLEIKGIVQGIGFRPFIYRLANSLKLAGSVFNSSGGVIIDIEGKISSIDKFLKKISSSPPPLANIDNIEIKPLNKSFKSFKIKESRKEEGRFVPIAPDISICKDCLDELFLPDDRRFAYPFINCTNCGPRLTIIKDIPYDRDKTTMSKFLMCKACNKEYNDSNNRRYHSQPNACPICGPEVFLLKNDGRKVECSNPIKEASLLLKNNIIAIKGLGGFHLACNALDDKLVKELRKRKKREKEKPFAIMVKDISNVKRYCRITKEEEELLNSPKRPIVLLKKLKACKIAKSVSNNKYLGIMLPYTPLHYLLLSSLPFPLVMTSGNFQDEPLVKDNSEAIKRLFKIADYFLMHNRDIYTRCDDSVTCVIFKKESIIRRSRGYAPLPITLGFKLKQVLATGAELKNTFCLTRENYAFVSSHIGDLKNYETLEYYKEAIEHFKKIFKIEPEIIAYDLHPYYLSTKFAKEHFLPLIPIQHHHAHIASCMAENQVDEPVIGVAFDGIGYGTDGNIWGGEFMIADYKSFNRIAHFRYIPMPGGDMATKEPYRMAISYLYKALGNDFISLEFNKRWKDVDILIKMIDRNINSPLTSSCGRLFDAVSSILGICDKVDYEAQAAILLEMLAKDIDGGYKYDIVPYNGKFEIDTLAIISQIVEDMLKKTKKGVISSKFHNTLVEIISDVCKIINDKFSIKKVALSGGVFQNRYLTEKAIMRLKRDGFISYLHSKLPANDGGISLGQAIIGSRKCV